jgi:L-asparagine transporter-like permease
MIAIGGVIGAGLFGGSGAGIHTTGPGILVSYAIAGLLVVLVMRMLGEMSAASADTGSFSAYADRAIGHRASPVVFRSAACQATASSAGQCGGPRGVPCVPVSPNRL